jgi:hypothetical protein
MLFTAAAVVASGLGHYCRAAAAAVFLFSFLKAFFNLVC